jgi:hypothetical protein
MIQPGWQQQRHDAAGFKGPGILDDCDRESPVVIVATVAGAQLLLEALLVNARSLGIEALDSQRKRPPSSLVHQQHAHHHA